jgi:hypothetical protein
MHEETGKRKEERGKNGRYTPGQRREERGSDYLRASEFFFFPLSSFLFPIFLPSALFGPESSGA